MDINIFQIDMEGIIIEIYNKTSGLIQSLTPKKNTFYFFNCNTTKMILGTNVLFNMMASRKPQYDFEATNIRIVNNPI